MKFFSIITIVVAVLGIFGGLFAAVCGFIGFGLGHPKAWMIIIQGLILLFSSVSGLLMGIFNLNK